jgi:hypothetical protein
MEMWTSALITFIILSISYAITRLAYRTITGKNEIKVKVTKRMRGFHENEGQGGSSNRPEDESLMNGNGPVE